MYLGYEAVNLFSDNLMTKLGINNSPTCWRSVIHLIGAVQEPKLYKNQTV